MCRYSAFPVDNKLTIKSLVNIIATLYMYFNTAKYITYTRVYNTSWIRIEENRATKNERVTDNMYRLLRSK
jgi:hypothetical protein